MWSAPYGSSRRNKSKGRGHTWYNLRNPSGYQWGTARGPLSLLLTEFIPTLWLSLLGRGRVLPWALAPKSGEKKDLDEDSKMCTSEKVLFFSFSWAVDDAKLLRTMPDHDSWPCFCLILHKNAWKGMVAYWSATRQFPFFAWIEVLNPHFTSEGRQSVAGSNGKGRGFNRGRGVHQFWLLYPYLSFLVHFGIYLYFRFDFPNLAAGLAVALLESSAQ